MTSPFTLLGLEPTATVDEVKRAWREMARTLHPDTGGDPDVFHATHEAYTEALDIAEHRKCVSCGGKGTVEHRVGVHALTMPCPTCKS